MDIKDEVIIMFVLVAIPKIALIVLIYSIRSMCYVIFPTRKEAIKIPLSFIDRCISNIPLDRTFCGL